MPADTVYVGRGSRWGNPYRIGEHGTRQEVIAKYAALLAEDAELRTAAKTHLRGKQLACWCRLEEACHADVLLAVANE
jgi:hypothetical protein